MLEDAGFSAPTMEELRPSQENALRFHHAISAKYGAAVYVYDRPEYSHMRLFMSEDRKNGFAIKSDGDIVSVFSGGDGSVYGMMILATEQGGTKLDAFDTVLPDVYSINGFREVARVMRAGGMKQREIAERLGVSESAVHHYLKG